MLKYGLSLVDLPGQSDANRARVAYANNRLRDYTYYIVIAKIGRVKSNPFVIEYLGKGFKTRGSGRVILVLTYADDISPTTVVYGTTT